MFVFRVVVLLFVCCLGCLRLFPYVVSVCVYLCALLCLFVLFVLIVCFMVFLFVVCGCFVFYFERVVFFFCV